MRRNSLFELVGVTFLFTSVLILLNSCGPSKAVKDHLDMMKEAHAMQKPMLVRTSLDDNRPDWTKKTVYEKGSVICFTGAFIDGADYPLSIRCANAEALKSAVQAISQYIRSEFSSYVQGSNSAYGGGIDRYVSDGIATFSENIHVQGIKQAELYYEEMFSPQAMQPSYNVFVQLEMGKADYLHAKAEVLRKLRDKFNSEGQVEAKKKADKLLEDLKNEVKTAA